MKIVVNTRLLRRGQMDGIGWFTYNTMRRITAAQPHVEFHFLFDSGIDDSFLFSDNIIPVNLFPPAKHAILNIAWFEWSVKRYLKKVQPDLFFSPDGILCLGWNGKQHGVMHDINFYHRPQDLKFTNRKYYNYFFPRYAKIATRMATVSEYSRQDISKTFGVDDNRIDVVYNGINSFYHPVANDTVEATRNRCSNGQPYFIFIGTLSPRKNVLNTLRAFELLKKETALGIKLIIAGGGMYRVSEMQQFKNAMEFGNDVIFTGRVDDIELNNLLASSTALVFIPFFEGFGIPPIEAMQCDVPVIASNATSVPEVVGNAAILVDPHDVSEIKDAMLKIATDTSLSKSLVEKGQIRRNYFSWDKTSDLLWSSIEKALND